MVKRFNNNKLRGKIYEKYKSMSAFSDDVGISRYTIRQKLMNKTDFTRGDIVLFCEKLEIKPEEIVDYFFV